MKLIHIESKQEAKMKRLMAELIEETFKGQDRS
jgi:hypothetical protein